MINLNECKFGDKLRTESGKMVVYLGKTRPMKWDGINEIPSTYYCAMAYGDSFGYMEYHENGWHDRNSSDNIVGKWEDAK